MNDTKSILKSQRLLPDHFKAYFWDTRFTGKDFIDLFFVAKKFRPIDSFIGELRRKYLGVQFNTNHILRSLCYFDEAEKEPMSNMIAACDWLEIKGFYVNEVKRLSQIV